MKLNRKQVEALFDRAKLYECGEDADGYTLTVQHMLDEMFGPENPITVKETVNEIIKYIGSEEIAKSKVVGIEMLVGRLAMSEFERGRAS